MKTECAQSYMIESLLVILMISCGIISLLVLGGSRYRITDA